VDESEVRTPAELIAQLDSEDAAERETAGAALSVLASDHDPDAIAALIQLIDHPDSKLRYHAYWGLARAGEPAVAALIEQFRHQDDDGRSRIAGVLGQIGLPARSAIPELSAALLYPHTSAAGQAAYALGRMQAREAIPELIDAYGEARKRSTHRQISRALSAMGSDQARSTSKQKLVASLVNDLESTHPGMRREAAAYCTSLYRWARKDRDYDYPTREQLRPLIPRLIAIVEDSDDDGALSAIRALELAGRDSQAAAGALARRLGDGPLHHAAMLALRAIGTPEALRSVRRHLAFEALEQRVRTSFSVPDHQGRVQVAPFFVTGSVEDGVRMSARFLYPSPQPQRPEHVVIVLESYSPERRLENAREMVWSADGAHIDVNGLGRTYSSSQLGVIETISALVPLDAFLRIATAEDLQGRIGSIEFSVAESDRAALRHLASKIPLSIGQKQGAGVPASAP
jgi:HEAT repeat protein